MLRTGILMPRSTLYPTLGLDLLNGLKQSLRRVGAMEDVQFFIDNIGFGTNEPEIYTKAEKMLLQDDIDLLLVCADARIAEMLQPLFTASNKILLIVNFGASFPDTWQPAPTTITHTLNFSLQTLFTGMRAAATSSKEAINFISYYDGGYRLCYNMLQAHQGKGGIPVFNHVTQLRTSEFSLQPALDFLEAHPEVQTALCLFSGEQAVKFYNEMALRQAQKPMRLFAAPMMLEDSLQKLPGGDFSINGVEGYIPWHGTLDNENNRSFLSCLKEAGIPANYFSVLGWDAGLVILEVVALRKAGIQNAAQLVPKLTKAVYESPRGWMKIDGPTHQSYGPSYLAGFNAVMQISIGEELPDMDAAWKLFVEKSVLTGEGSSWRNTYLCI
jgi:branched-chain amino acid transport system substrate-binding protein